MKYTSGLLTNFGQGGEIQLLDISPEGSHPRNPSICKENLVQVIQLLFAASPQENLAAASGSCGAQLCIWRRYHP